MQYAPPATMKTSRVAWDGTRPPRSIYEVWDFIGVHLHEVKDKLHYAAEEFYDKEQRMSHLCNVGQALKMALDRNTNLGKVSCIQDLKQLVQLSLDAPQNSSRLLQKARQVLQPYLHRTKKAGRQLDDLSQLFIDDVLRHLEQYCSTYVKLGIADDDFYRALRSRTVKIREVLADFEKISASLYQNLKPSRDYFCDSHFSQELSLEFDCDSLGIIRIIPDLIQKLETVIDTGQDWLRSDKVYIEQIQKEVENAHGSLKQKDIKLQKVKLKYDQLFLVIKQKKHELEDMDEDPDMIQKELAKLEMEISAVSKTLSGCRDQLRDLYSACQISSGSDNVDGHEPCDSECMSQSNSTYRSRLLNDISSYEVKLEKLLLNQKQLKKKMEEKRDQIQTEIQRLSKKLMALGDRKSECLEETRTQRVLLQALEQTLVKRLRPGSSPTPDQNQDWKTSSKTRKSHHRKKRRSRRTKELIKAFRLVKNNIGYQWKDLTRMLPYGDDKELSEIDIEIKAIEYEYPGQLKEQAYQSLVRWYNQAGRGATVETLNEALRDIELNRLADTIENEVTHRSTDTSETEVTR